MFIITSSNSSKPLDFLKKAFHKMAFFIEPVITFPGIFGIHLWRNCISSPGFGNVRPDFLSTVCFISKNVAIFNWQL